jgi:metal-responsive CopG/Arc/MetJ family transcriptional regulator
VDEKMAKYQGVCLPNELLYRIDQDTKGMGYTSRTDFIKQAIRRELERLSKHKEKQET